MEYKIDLDDFMEELFYELEKQSDSGRGHECLIIADNEQDAAEILANKITPFFAKHFKYVGE